MAAGNRAECDLWMWDGANEYEGLLLKLEDRSFTARLRQARKTPSTVTGLGKRVGASPEAQRQFTRRRFLAHYEGAGEGTLFEAQIDSVQASADGPFDYLISGRFGILDDAQLETLRTLTVQGAAALLQRNAS